MLGNGSQFPKGAFLDQLQSVASHRIDGAQGADHLFFGHKAQDSCHSGLPVSKAQGGEYGGDH